jgi:hypothetical protein
MEGDVMTVKIFSIFIVAVLSAYNAYGQSFSCTPEHVTFASNGGSLSTVEKTTVNWKRIDYHIVDKSAVAITYKNLDDPATSINPTQRDELTVLENLPDKVVMMKKKIDDMMELTVDVIFPKDGNGYSFYVSDYPKKRMPGKSELVNLSKLYMLKCKDISNSAQ